MGRARSTAFGRWLQQELDNRGWGPRQAEAYTGIGASLFSNYLRGLSHPNLRTVRRLASAFDVGEDEIEVLIPHDENTRASEDRILDELRRVNARLERLEESVGSGSAPIMRVPLVHQTESARQPGIVGDEYVPVVIREGERHEPESYLALLTSGRRLEPRVGDGDVLLVDKTSEPSSGDIVVAIAGSETLVREWRVVNGLPCLLDTGEAPVIQVTGDVDVIGKVVELRRKDP